MAGADTAQTNALPREMCQFKLILVGTTDVGKSSLVTRFVERRFCNHTHTVGAAFATETVVVDGMRVKLNIWDTAGQERFHSLVPVYYRGAQAAIVVYDITNNDSFLATKLWVEEVRKHADPDVVISLAGNKADLLDQRAVESIEAQQYADENGLLFAETSALKDMNVRDIFMAIARKLPKSYSGHERSGEPYMSGHKQSKHGSGSCCRN